MPSDPHRRKTVATFRRMIRRRIRLSERAITTEAEAMRSGRGSSRLIDYHEGCIGLATCLLEDVEQWSHA